MFCWATCEPATSHGSPYGLRLGVRVNLTQESGAQVVDRFGQLDAIGAEQVIVGLARVHAEGALDKVPDLVAQMNTL